MTTSVVGFDDITASTDDPIGMLSVCHGRVRKQCSTLRALLPHLEKHGADDQAAAAAHRIMRYFDEAAQHHHADEEMDLFPRLLTAGAECDREEINSLCNRLLEEHRDMAAIWSRLRQYLETVQTHQLPDLTAMQTVLMKFTTAYESHTDFEDRHLLPLAKRILSAAATRELGLNMKARRQIN